MLKDIAKSIKHGYVFKEVNSGQVWLPEEIVFRFIYKNKEDFIRIISHFIDLQEYTEEMRLNNKSTVFDVMPMSEFTEFINPSKQKIKGLENDPSWARISCLSTGFFSIVIAGIGNDFAGPIKNPENLETALKIDQMIENYGLVNDISHELSKFSNVVKV